jgi:hypothetical protein
MSTPKMKPIWFFVGLILIVMGGIIFISGIYQFLYPPAVKTILAETHPAIWWGAVMFIFGSVMYWKTRKETV